MNIILQTSRLYLREIEITDVHGMFELDSDPLVQRYVGNKTISSIGEAMRNIEFIRTQYLENGIGRWAVIEQDTHAFVGWAGFKLITVQTNKQNNYFDLGYRLIRKHWGKGYATELAKGCVNYGFQTLMLKEIFAIADEENIASRRVLEKAGLKSTETFLYEGVPHLWFKISNPKT
jgi:ribosomal-protein-alanine N-acetyltransferase